MRRALAVLGAAAMVAAALAVRSALDDEGGERASESAGGVVVCSVDLLEYCEALPGSVEVRAETAAVVADALTGGSLASDVDAWVTSAAWLEVVSGRRPDAFGEARPLGRSRVVVAAAPGRADALGQLCGREDVWACLGGAVGRSWGPDLGAGDPAWRELAVGLRDPDGATGLSVLMSAAVGWFDGTGFAANDLDVDFTDFLARLAAASEGDEEPARTMAVRPGQYSAAGTVAQVVDRLGARGVAAVEPTVDVEAVVVAVPLTGRSLPSLDGIEAALRGDGWRDATDDDLAPTLKTGVLAALHSLWEDVSP